MGFILAPIALFLFALMGVIHSIVTLIQNISRRAFFRTTSKIKFQFAYDVDVFGNYLFQDTWNFIFSKGPELFGTFGETISSALGRGRRFGYLSFFGWLFSWFLDIIWFTDWSKGGHCNTSIMDFREIKEKREEYLKI